MTTTLIQSQSKPEGSQALPSSSVFLFLRQLQQESWYVVECGPSNDLLIHWPGTSISIATDSIHIALTMTDPLRKRLGPRREADLTEVLKSLEQDLDAFIDQVQQPPSSKELLLEFLEMIAYSMSVHEQYGVPILRERDVMAMTGDHLMSDFENSRHSTLRRLLKKAESLVGYAHWNVFKGGDFDNTVLSGSLEEAQTHARECLETLRREDVEEKETQTRIVTNAGRKRSASNLSTPDKPCKKLSFHSPTSS